MFIQKDVKLDYSAIVDAYTIAELPSPPNVLSEPAEPPTTEHAAATRTLCCITARYNDLVEKAAMCKTMTVIVVLLRSVNVSISPPPKKKPQQQSDNRGINTTKMNHSQTLKFATKSSISKEKAPKFQKIPGGACPRRTSSVAAFDPYMYTLSTTPF